MGTQTKPGGGGGAGLGGQFGNFQPGKDFWEFNPRNIAGLNNNLRGAANGALGLFGAGGNNTNAAGGMFSRLGAGGSGYLDKAMKQASQYSGGKLPSEFGQINSLLNSLRGASTKQVTGANLDSDKALEAGRRNFAINQKGNIQNAAAAMGLGRSNTAVNAEAMARASADVPLIQDALGREERGIGREIGGLQSMIQSRLGMGNAQLGAHDAATRALLGGAGQEASQLASAGQGLAGVGSQQFNQLQGAVQGNAQIGAGMRDINQERLDAPYEEQQRLYAEALNSMYGPLGMLGSLLGGTSTQNKKG